jgi:hypothetical protein
MPSENPSLENLTQGLDSVSVSMAYSAPVDGLAHIRIYPPVAGRSNEAPRRERHDVKVYDCRSIADQLDMDVAGFSFQRAPTTFSDFFNEEAVREHYYPEVVSVLREQLKAQAVFVFDHNVRSQPRSDQKQAGVRAPVDGAHNDYTLNSGPRRINEILAYNGASDLIGKRAALVNLWRPLRGPVQDHPMAVCDARTTHLDDFIPTRIEHYLEDNLETPHLTGEVYSFRHSEAHRWFFASDMQSEEVLLLKCFDTAHDGIARFTGHTGFKNPACPPDFLPRESIEARTVVVYE